MIFQHYKIKDYPGSHYLVVVKVKSMVIFKRSYFFNSTLVTLQYPPDTDLIYLKIVASSIFHKVGALDT